MTTAAAAPPLAIPAPRGAGEQFAPPPAFSRALGDVDRDLADLAVQEQRHRDMLAGARRALVDCAARRDLLLEQRRRSITRAVEQLAAG